MIATAAPSDQEIQAEFVTMLPELSSRCRSRFRRFGRDRAAEFTAEAVASSWACYRSARMKGKLVTVGNLSFYTTRLVLAGRRLAGTSSTDVFSDTPGARHRPRRVLRMTEPDPDARPSGRRASPTPLYQLVCDRRWRWPIIDYVSAKLDWDTFVAQCGLRDRQIIALRQEGTPQNEIAAALGISPPAVNQHLKALRSRWEAQSALAEAAGPDRPHGCGDGGRRCPSRPGEARNGASSAVVPANRRATAAD